MGFGNIYSLETIISAFLTFAVIMFSLRLYLKFVSTKRTKIQRPDWLKEREPRYGRRSKRR